MKKIISSCAILFLCVLSVTLNSCKKLTAYDLPPDGSIYQKITIDTYNFTFIKSLVDKTGMADMLSSGSYTLFAPTNAAFYASGFTTAVLDNMDMDSLTMLVKNHIVQGKVDAASLSDGQELTSLSGSKIQVRKVGDDLYVDGGDITNPDLVATNGMVQVIDKVLMSRMSVYDRIDSYNAGSTTYSFSFLVAAIDRASEGSENFKQILSDPSASFTFFAPMDGAFKDAGYASVAAVENEDPDTLAAILNSQLVQGRVLTTDFDTTNTAPMHSVNDSILIYADRQKRSNNYTYFMVNGLTLSGGYANMMGGSGVVHAVQRFFNATHAVTSLKFIESDTSLTFFRAALQQASKAGELDFMKILGDPAPSYTVFAVNNQGFRDGGYASLADVNAADPATLTTMLKYHLAEKRQNNINYGDNTGMQTLLIDPTTVPPVPLSVRMYISTAHGFQVQGDLNADAYSVLSGNNVTTNGLVNVIGGILLP